MVMMKVAVMMMAVLPTVIMVVMATEAPTVTQAEAIAMIRNVSRLGEVFAAIDDALSCRHPPPA